LASKLENFGYNMELYEFSPFKKAGGFACLCTACIDIRDNRIANHRPTPTVPEVGGTQCAKCGGFIPTIADELIKKYTRWNEMDPKQL
jgi:hypothetical protein